MDKRLLTPRRFSTVPSTRNSTELKDEVKYEKMIVGTTSEMSYIEINWNKWYWNDNEINKRMRRSRYGNYSWKSDEFLITTREVSEVL